MSAEKPLGALTASAGIVLVVLSGHALFGPESLPHVLSLTACLLLGLLLIDEGWSLGTGKLGLDTPDHTD